jgi:hypothetical protein
MVEARKDIRHEPASRANRCRWRRAVKQIRALTRRYDAGLTCLDERLSQTNAPMAGSRFNGGPMASVKQIQVTFRLRRT